MPGRPPGTGPPPGRSSTLPTATTQALTGFGGSSVSLAGITDGTSNTAAFSERVKAIGSNIDPGTSAPFDAGKPTASLVDRHRSGVDQKVEGHSAPYYNLCKQYSTRRPPPAIRTWPASMATTTISPAPSGSRASRPITRYSTSCRPTPGAAGPGCRSPHVASSQHPGVVNVLFCDGSVKAIKSTDQRQHLVGAGNPGRRRGDLGGFNTDSDSRGNVGRLARVRHHASGWPLNRDRSRNFPSFVRIEIMIFSRRCPHGASLRWQSCFWRLLGVLRRKAEHRYLAQRGDSHRCRYRQGKPASGGKINFNPSNSGRIVRTSPREIRSRWQLHGQNLTGDKQVTFSGEVAIKNKGIGLLREYADVKPGENKIDYDLLGAGAKIGTFDVSQKPKGKRS